MSGATGSGKSTTLAALVDLINHSYHVKILTIEDPVEYEHTSVKALISHVEVGRDTPSFEHGLRQAMRQAPDVILIGEIRDPETAQLALRAADTGHLVLATVHSANAAQTVERLLAMIPPETLAIAREQLAAALVAVLAQRLAVGKDGASARPSRSSAATRSSPSSSSRTASARSTTTSPPASAACRPSTSTCCSSTTTAPSAAPRPWPSPPTPRPWPSACACRGRGRRVESRVEGG